MHESRIHKKIGIVAGYVIWRSAAPWMSYFCFDPTGPEKYRKAIFNLCVNMEKAGLSADQAKAFIKLFNNKYPQLCSKQ